MDNTAKDKLNDKLKEELSKMTSSKVELVKSMAKFYKLKGEKEVPTQDVVKAISSILNRYDFQEEKLPYELQHFLEDKMKELPDKERIYTLLSILDTFVYGSLLNENEKKNE